MQICPPCLSFRNLDHCVTDLTTVYLTDKQKIFVGTETETWLCEKPVVALKTLM